MKKFISLFTMLSIILSMLGTFTVFAEERAADITKISTLAELQAFRDDVNSGNTYEGKTVKLAADIDMSEEYGNGKKSWTPIGDSPDRQNEKSFWGTFDGDNHTISGLYSYTEEEYGTASLFGRVYGTIENLNVKGTVIANYQRNSYAAGIANFLAIDAQMLNCSFDGLVKNPNYPAGGLVELNMGLVSGCTFKGKVEGAHLVAGIASTGDGTIINCVNEGEIIGTGTVGAITGYGQTIKNCVNTGCVTERTYVGTSNENSEESTENYVFGCVGGIAGAMPCMFAIENCYNTGAVSGSNYVGGILGVAEHYSDNETLLQVKNCYNIGSITSTTGNYGEHSVGAIIGSREYNYTLDGKNYTKILTSEAVDCYYLIGTADKGTGGIANDTTTALTSEQFANKSSFANWDFDAVWKMEEMLGRPVLRSNRKNMPVATPMPMPVPTPAAPAETRDRVDFEYQNNSTILGKIIFEKTEPPKQQDMRVMIAYEEDGVLTDAESLELSDMSITINILPEYKNCDIFIYVWDKNMKPLMEVQKIVISNN